VGRGEGGEGGRGRERGEGGREGGREEGWVGAPPPCEILNTPLVLCRPLCTDEHGALQATSPCVNSVINIK